MLRPLLVLLLAAAAASCPTDLPGGCSCKGSDGRLSISCVSVSLAAVLPKVVDRSVVSLRLVYCSVSALERPIALKGLRTLELAHCGISSIDPKSLASVAPSLEELSLADNRLTEVPAHLPHMPALAKLTLNRNVISDLPSGVFSFAPSLAELRMEDNRVCSLQQLSLNETKSSLALLDLSGNCLSSLSIRSAPLLAYLDLSLNKLSDLSPLSLLSLPSLVEVRLSDNLLSRLSPLSISGTPELRYLYLQNNLLDSLAALPPLPKLEILDARSNRLTRLSSLFESPSLRQLRLDSNHISALEPRALTGHPKLQLLSIQDNVISSLGSSSFEGLSELVVLLLSNNRLTKLDGAVLSPLRSLQKLNLHNNSMDSVDVSSFSSLKQLTTLDMGKNQLQRLPKGIFESLPKLFWVDVSGNKLVTFEKGTFTKRVSNLLLANNPLVCDEALDWFVQWLVVNRVRSSLRNHPDVVCASPLVYEGVALRNLMIKKVNETMKVIGLQPDKPKAGQALVSNLLPGMLLMNSLVPAGQQAAVGLGQVPDLGALLNGIPSLRSLPLPAAAGGSPVPAGIVRSMNSAVEQFAAPLVRFATGGQPQAADFEQLMQAIPKMIEAAPGGTAAVIDVSKLPPDVIVHVMRGGQIPGIPRDTLDRIVANHMRKMADVAAAIGRGEKPEDVEKYLPLLDRLTAELISSVMNGQSLSGLEPQLMEPIKQYYLNSLPLPSPSSSNSSSVPSLVMPAFSFTPASLEMMRLLPPGYNISRIPVEIMSAISKGEMPDLKLLPDDLQEHLKFHTDKMFHMLEARAAAARSEASEDKSKPDLRKWESPVGTATHSPYDLNAIKSDLEADKAAINRMVSAGVIGLLAVVSVIIVVSMCIAQHRKMKKVRLESAGGLSIDNMRANANSTPTILSQPRLDSTRISQQGGIIHRRSPLVVECPRASPSKEKKDTVDDIKNRYRVITASIRALGLQRKRTLCEIVRANRSRNAILSKIEGQELRIDTGRWSKKDRDELAGTRSRARALFDRATEGYPWKRD